MPSVPSVLCRTAGGARPITFHNMGASCSKRPPTDAWHGTWVGYNDSGMLTTLVIYPSGCYHYAELGHCTRSHADCCSCYWRMDGFGCDENCCCAPYAFKVCAVCAFMHACGLVGRHAGGCVRASVHARVRAWVHVSCLCLHTCSCWSVYMCLRILGICGCGAAGLQRFS